MISKLLAATAATSLFTTMSMAAPIVISGFMANPAGTDSPYEYVQLIATENINFSSSSYSVVVSNNGTATSSGWAAGSGLSYGFNLTSGTVSRGDVFYVGGSGKLINGGSSTDISSATWLRTINTGTTSGDGFGSANSGGVFGNGGSNADGIAVFSGLTSSITSSTIPVDAVYFGTAVGTAKPATGGYKMPNNDRYTSTGVFGDTGNSYLYADPGSGAYTKLTGTYNYLTDTWSTARTGSQVASPTALSSISTEITLVPEPASLGLLGLASVAGLRRRSR
jgi:hypothetical protein